MEWALILKRAWDIQEIRDPMAMEATIWNHGAAKYGVSA